MNIHDRQLVAILFTDIVGYTAVMEENEHVAVALIKHYNTVLNQLVVSHNGKVLNYYGDGSLCIFPSATEAINCAIEMQRELQKEPSVPLRIGLHVGEIFFQDDQVLGDGVNIACRVQSLGQANTILFSKEIFEHIRNHPEFKAVSLGLFDFKNVVEPVEVFALANEGLHIPERKTMSGKLKEKVAENKPPKRKTWFIAGALFVALLVTAFFIYSRFSKAKGGLHKEISIAVLPFKNESEDKVKNEPFCYGMMLALLKNLTRINELRPIAAQSVEKYRDTKMSIHDIAKELGDVKYVVEGSVERDGNDVQISASLVDANTDQQIWADNFSGKMENIFTLQENIAEQIASALQVTITPEEKSRISKVISSNPRVLDAYYEAQMAYMKYAFTAIHTDSEYRKIQSLCDKLLALDSTIAAGYVLKAETFLTRYGNSNRNKEYFTNAFTDTLEELSQKALSLDNNSVDAMILMASYYELTGNYNQEYYFLQKAFSLNPNNLGVVSGLSSYYAIDRIDAENAIRYAKKALAIDPQSVFTSSIYLNLFNAYFNICDFEKAAFYAQLAIHQDLNINDKSWGLFCMTWLNMVLGNGDEVIKYATENLQISDSNFTSLYSIAEAYCRLKDNCDTAVRLYERIWKISPLHVYPHRYAIALWKTGRKREAMRMMDSSILWMKTAVSLGRTPIENYDMAGIYAFMGNKEAAYNILRKPPEDFFVWGQGLPYLIQTDPLFDNLRNDAEFKLLVQNAINAKSKERDRIRKMEEEGKL